MQVKIKLSKSQINAFQMVLQCCLKAIEGTSLLSVQYKDALMNLLMKITMRKPTLKDKNSITLTDMETVAFFVLSGSMVKYLQPYEKSLTYHILAEIERQKDNYITLVNGNLYNRFEIE